MTIALKPNGDGSAEIQVNGVTQIAISAAGVVTFPNTTNTQLGVGQTWQDVKASRVSGTTYTNSTSKPITVNVATNGTNAVVSATVGGVAVANAAWGGTPSSSTQFCSVIVPAGATYVFTLTGAVQIWSELR